MEWQISNASLIYSDRIEKAMGLHIKDGLIENRLPLTQTAPRLTNLNLHGFFVFPGLVNAHDSLLASYYAFHGTNHPYHNWLAWDNELKASLLFRQRMLLEPSELYQLGSYRNILSGVTTVVDHIPHHVRRPFQKHVLPRLLPDFGISHSMGFYSLKWGQGIRQEHEYAIRRDLPYIIHIAEGFDEESLSSLAKLNEAGALSEQTVLVHGLALSLSDLDIIAKAGAHLVWCPVSNTHIYQKTAPIKEARERGINICLGTDSAMSGSENLLHDIRFAQECYQKQYGEDLDPKFLLKMVTENAKNAFRLKNYSTFEPGSHADFIVLKGKYPNAPLASFAEATLKDIYLVVCQGKPVYSDAGLEQIFTSCGVSFERFSLQGHPGQSRIIKRHTHSLMLSLREIINKAVLENSLDSMPIII